jgi:nucleoside-diphosphate-sugar epimerase
MKKKVVITGVTGFIGQYLAQLLLEKKYEVIGISRKSSPLKHNFPILFGELTDKKFLEKVIKGAYAVFHLAGITTHNKLTNEAVSSYKQNLFITLNVLDVFSSINKDSFLLLPSSGKVYGKIQYLPIDENHPINPTIPLGYIKLSQEYAVKIYASQFTKNRYAIARIFNIYGPNQRKQFLLPTIIEQLKKSNTIFLGDVNSKRDYLYIYDLCTALITIMEQSKEIISIFNIGSGKSISPKEIVQELEIITNKKIDIKTDSSKLRKGESSEEKASIKKLTKLGWKPQYSLKKGLHQIL